MKLIKKFIPYYKPYIGVFLMDLLCASILSIIHFRSSSGYSEALFSWKRAV